MGTAEHKTIASSLSRRLAAQAAPWHVELFDDTPVNRQDIPQESLDLANKTRRNVFPWRGQFSPELAELLLTHYASNNAFVADPFAGVGTTLFEAARQGLPAIGVEINPAAVTMAGTVMFVQRSLSERRAVLDAAAGLLQQRVQSHAPLFAGNQRPGSPVNSIVELIREYKGDPPVCNILANVLIRLLESPRPDDSSFVMSALRMHEAVVLNLPTSSAEYEVAHADARSMPVRTGTVDFIITSPPYINVFNYHQNCRRAMELLGWNLLGVARSELGANRKHRANRFLTVIQYCVDISMALAEFKRVLRPGGRAIMIMGRESCVRGVSFRNGCLVGALAASGGLKLVCRQERKFINKFGELIYEDILHLEPAARCSACDYAEPRALAVHLLEDALSRSTKEDVGSDIQAAIAGADGVTASPLFTPKSPTKP
jgi:SAM-dependent methyltransferase